MRVRDRRPDADPLPDQPPDVRTEPWYQMAADIAILRASGDYAWAERTLASIQQSIERTHVVTAWQREAVAKIVASERAPGRSYDRWGFGRRW